VKDKRPVYLSVNPLQFHFPVAALASIVHRMTGVLLLIAVGYFLYLLQLALPHPSGFDAARALLAEPTHQVILFICLSGLVYHLILGVKHLLLDFHIADSLDGSRTMTILCLSIFAACEVLLLLWIWG
jgi:succinate dehydrogenase / fumarate reductase cytochrome b subunit